MASIGQTSDDEAYDEDYLVENIHKHKELLVSKLRVFDLINGKHTFKNIISHDVLRKIEAIEPFEEHRAAREFWDNFLESKDKSKYGVLRDALRTPEHTLVRRILCEKGFDTESLSMEEHSFACYRRLLIENIESDPIWLAECLERDLISQSDANKIEAHSETQGDNRGNAMLLNAVSKSSNAFSRFLHVLWKMDRKECVKEINQEFYKRMEAQDGDGTCTSSIASSRDYNIKPDYIKGMNDLTLGSDSQPIAHRTRSKIEAAAILEHPQNTQLVVAVISPVMMGLDSQQYGGYKVLEHRQNDRRELGFQSLQTRGYNQTTSESPGVKKELNSYQERSKNRSEEQAIRYNYKQTDPYIEISPQSLSRRSESQKLPGRSLEQPHQRTRGEDPRAMSDDPDNIGARPRVYRCQRCSKPYCSKEELTDHQTSCTGKLDRRLNSTGKLDRQSNSTGKLDRQLNSTGKLDRQLTSTKQQSLQDLKRTLVRCRHCQIPFADADKLKTHEEKCSRPDVFRCSQCGDAFKSKEYYDQHKSKQHGYK